MSLPNTISCESLTRVLGTPSCPRLVDVRTKEDFDAEPVLIPGSIKRDWQAVHEWAPKLKSASIIICHGGLKLSHGVAAWLRHNGSAADVLEGGLQAWRSAGQPVVPIAKIPNRKDDGRTVWVTRSRPKIDRIACPWLIRRFVDPDAVLLFVAPSEVKGVADRFGATAFDIDDTVWSHRGSTCTFDTMIDEWQLTTPPLMRMAEIVRAADTATLSNSPEAAGLLAISLGLSRAYDNDLEQLAAGLTIYDALYRWCRDVTDETHNWPAKLPVA